MIAIIFTLFDGPWIGDPNLTARQRAELEPIKYEREGVIQLGKLKTTYCRETMTTTGECPSDEIATFLTIESQTEFTICFRPTKSYDNILRADEDIRLVKLGANFYIVGEPIYGRRGVRASTLIDMTNCNSE